MTEEHNIPKVYDPASVEKKWYKYWEEHRYFHAEVEADKKPFSIVIPPPNVTGQLHMGHALDNTLQDILIRWHRMMGHNTLWMPGYDHAGLATQIKVEEMLKQEEARPAMIWAAKSLSNAFGNGKINTATVSSNN